MGVTNYRRMDLDSLSTGGGVLFVSSDENKSTHKTFKVASALGNDEMKVLVIAPDKDDLELLKMSQGFIELFDDSKGTLSDNVIITNDNFLIGSRHKGFRASYDYIIKENINAILIHGLVTSKTLANKYLKLFYLLRETTGILTLLTIDPNKIKIPELNDIGTFVNEIDYLD